MDRYNNVRLPSAIGYVTPKDMLARRQVEIHTERDCSWKPPDSNVRVAACNLREERSGQPPRCRIAGEVDRIKLQSV